MKKKIDLSVFEYILREKTHNLGICSTITGLSFFHAKFLRLIDSYSVLLENLISR